MKRLAGALAGLVVALVVAVGPAAAGGDDRHYYVVGTGDYLFRIAVRTLGDGNRYPEIYQLNEGRVQDDGASLTDPVVLHPGWILLLPDDASGGSVRIGPLPGPEPSGTARAWWIGAGTAVVGAAAALVLLRRRRRVRRAPERPGFPPGDAVRVANPAGALEVRLTGPSTAVWLAHGEPRPEMVLPVELGERDGWRLWVDLAGAPGPVTVTGPVAAGRRQARALADRLHAEGHAVLVVGNALGEQPPPGWTALPALPAVEELPDTAGVLLCGGLHGAELAAARAIASAEGCRVVPVVVGEVVRGRWSLSAVAEGNTP